MVVSDINLICVSQQKKTILNIPNSRVLCFNRNISNKSVIYKDRYKLAKNIKGIWYQIYSIKRDLGDYSCELLDINVEQTANKIVFLQENVRNSIIIAIEELLCLSPENKVLFFADLQGYCTKVKKIKFNDFLSRFNDNDILFNTIYIISKGI